MQGWRRRNPLFSGRFGLLIAVVILGLAAWISDRLEPVQSDLAGRAYATDGDTLHLNGQRLRLLGIDAPELEQMCRDKADISWPCGQVAKSRLNSLIGSAELICHPSGHDKFGRILAACDAGGSDLGAAMMLDGLAVSYDRYKAEEAVARDGKVGIWQGRFERPQQWRADARSGGAGET
ncbi:MAG: Succinoglycan biosynthesis protein [Hyphomicrobiales bacterium]|nr:Succinoglycan biosynthesis protein [Hyphomicrobiales bacterium]